MQRPMTFKRESEDEVIKRSGLTLDFDEIGQLRMNPRKIFPMRMYGIKKHPVMAAQRANLSPSEKNLRSRY